MPARHQRHILAPGVHAITLIFALAAIVGCSHAESTMPTVPSGPVQSDLQSNDPSSVGYPVGRSLWGLYEITVDPKSTPPVVIVPLRQSAFHVNIRTFLEDFPCTKCLKVKSLEPTSFGFNMTLAITHPFPGQSRLTGFDVRGIIFTNGTQLFPQLGVTASSISHGDSCVINANGFATLFNPTEFIGNNAFSYSRGKLLPPTMPDPTATLGAFKAFYSKGQSEDQGGRRAFLPGDTVTCTYQISHDLGTPMTFAYAVDASWEAPKNNPPKSLDDFPPSANCPEPFRIDVNQVDNRLTTDCGYVQVDVTVYDHQGIADLGACSLEAPGLCTAVLVDDTPIALPNNQMMYQFKVSNDLGAANPLGEAILLKVAHGQTDPHLGVVPAWYFFVARVTVPSEKPEIDSIKPSLGFQGTSVDTTIYGEGFGQNPKVSLYQGIDTLPGHNIGFDNSCQLHASFDLVGPIGQYTVYVQNQNGLWGELTDGFTVMKPITNCTGAFHTDTLGSGTIQANMVAASDTAFLTTGPSAGMMLATEQFGWGPGLVAVNVDSTIPSSPVPMPGAIGHSQYGAPISLDVDDNSGLVMVVWTQKQNAVDVFDPSTGNLVASIDLGPQAKVLGVDTDGHSGFWVAFSDTDPSPHVHHYFTDPGSGAYTMVPSDSFDLMPVYASIQDIAVLPDFRLYVFCTPGNGTILSYDISGSIPSLLATVGSVFPSPLISTSIGRAGDIEIDQTDPSSSSCRIVAFGNQQSGGCMAIKLDANLNTLATLALTNRYQSIAINPNPDLSKRNLTLYSRDKSPAEYRLLQAPAGW